MKHIKFISIMIMMATLVTALGFSFQTAQAASCATYHTVQRGESLSGIGAYYRTSWKTIANANGISSPYTIYVGQRLCIPKIGYAAGNYSSWLQTWYFSVIRVVKNTSVTIQTAKFPDNMLYKVTIGCTSCGINAIKVGNLDSGAGGKIRQTFAIPEEFSGVARLWIRLTQVNNGSTRTQYFLNSTAY